MINTRKVKRGQIRQVNASPRNYDCMYVILEVWDDGADIMWLTGVDIDRKDYFVNEELEEDIVVM